jgi:N-acetylglucosaminyl-diphospho-decaprenol L-rhamnosyltransferase
MTSFRDVSVIVPSYNARRHLARCLRALRDGLPDIEVVVVDGKSADGSAEMVAREHPEVTLLTCSNHGWAHATNRGVEVTTRQFLLFLNSDAFATASAVDVMRARLQEDAEVAAVAPMLENEDGSRQAVFGLWYWPTWRPITRVTPVPLLSAACMMTTRAHFERIGAFDEVFFLYNEEMDWCRRARHAGYRLELVPRSVTHVGGGSTTKSPLLQLESQRGFVYLSSKHFPSWVTTCLREAMRMEGALLKRVDPRPEYRSMWSRLESLMTRAAYDESPFDLSGRGVPDILQPSPARGRG